MGRLRSTKGRHDTRNNVDVKRCALGAYYTPDTAAQYMAKWLRLAMGNECSTFPLVEASS